MTCATNTINETHRRLYEKLNRDLGMDIINYLEDKDINEIMLNSDGKLWVDKSSVGQICVGRISRAQAYSIINSMAGIHGFVVSQHHPMLEADLPVYQSMRGERFTGQVPPIVSQPTFTLRKRSETILTLDDYLNTLRITEVQVSLLRQLIYEHKNILVCGGPGTGKTTVTNALISEAVNYSSNQRFVVLEDTPELQCQAENKVSMLTTTDVNMTGLLKAAMRMRPDRILIGEVRGAEALDMLKAWNTGCPGGICTVHANGTAEAVQRILDLAMEAGLKDPPIKLVLHTINAIVSVVRNRDQKGFIEEIAILRGYQDGSFKFEKLV